jgi:hypothetical protein
LRSCEHGPQVIEYPLHDGYIHHWLTAGPQAIAIAPSRFGGGTPLVWHAAILQGPWQLWPVVVTVLALNFLGDGLRDAADPYAQ